jgi:hypothetical protein
MAINPRKNSIWRGRLFWQSSERPNKMMVKYTVAGIGFRDRKNGEKREKVDTFMNKVSPKWQCTKRKYSDVSRNCLDYQA